jgi:isoamyl acetate esterase
MSQVTLSRQKTKNKPHCPSRFWKGWNGITNRNSKYSVALRETIASINPEALARHASNVRARLEASPECRVPCKIDTSLFTAGWYNIVFEVAFEDGAYWIARVRREPEVGEDLRSESERTEELESEVYTMVYVKANSTIPVPTVYDFSAERDAVIGCRFILMEALAGHPGKDRLQHFIPAEHRVKTYTQLADIKIQLSQLRFSKIGRLTGSGFGGADLKFSINAFQAPGCLHTRTSGPFESALDYYHDIRRHDLQKAFEREREDLCISAWLRVQAVPSIVQPQFNRGPFPLHHPDVGYDNLLFDDNYNITGMIDWTNAAILPIESFCVMPLEFGTYNYANEKSLDNLIFDILEGRERSITQSTVLSEYMKSPRSRAIILFNFGHLDNPIIVKQYSEGLTRYLYGSEMSYEDIRRMYRGSGLYEEMVWEAKKKVAL